MNPCWIGTVFFFGCHLDIYDEDFTLFDVSWVWLINNIFIFDTIRVDISCNNFHTTLIVLAFYLKIQGQNTKTNTFIPR
jgi:hypothetical protein